jgi:hypothetical protein
MTQLTDKAARTAASRMLTSGGVRLPYARDADGAVSEYVDSISDMIELAPWRDA